MVNKIFQDSIQSIRILFKAPAFTGVAILTLALGIGANTSIFSLVKTILLQPLPYKAPDRLVWVYSVRPDRDKSPFSLPDFIEYRDRNQTLDQIAASASWGVNLTGNGDPERLQGVRISSNAFELLGVNAVIGRTLQPEDDKPGANRVVVISYGLWRRRFAADPAIIGQPLRLDNESYTVVGVLPASFVMPAAEVDIAAPLSPDTHPFRGNRGQNFLRVMARLKPGLMLPQAIEDLNGIAGDLRRIYPKDNAAKIGVRLVPLHEELVTNVRTSLFLLLGAVSLVLLIACANLAGLLLARATKRNNEFCIRSALGASRARLIQQALTESLLLALLGGVAGITLSVWGVRGLVILSPIKLPRADEIQIDVWILAYALGVALITGVILGLAPALQASRPNLIQCLQNVGRGANESPGRNLTRSFLIVAEVALSLVLLIGAGLFIKSFVKVQSVDPGVKADNLLVIRVSMPRARYSSAKELKAFYEQLTARVRQLPGVESAAAASLLPLSGLQARVTFDISGRPPVTAAETPGAQFQGVTPGYFQTMGVPIIKGREFTYRDLSNSQLVIVINEACARKFWPGVDPLGAHLEITDGLKRREFEIVGVVGNVKHLTLDENPMPDIYVVMDQFPEEAIPFIASNINWVFRTMPPPRALATAVRNEIRAVDGDVPVSSVTTFEDLQSASVAPRRFILFQISVFAGAALVLTFMGLYSVIAFMVSQRRQEIGIRMALGAQRRHLLQMVLWQSLKPVLVGLFLGLVGAFALSSTVSHLLYGAGARDLFTFAGMTLLLGCVALLASYIPARKATMVDPIIALRND
jgi:putative ABC transport system permease protein